MYPVPLEIWIRRGTIQLPEIASGPAASGPCPISLAVVVCLHCDDSWTATAGTGLGQLEPTVVVCESLVQSACGYLWLRTQTWFNGKERAFATRLFLTLESEALTTSLRRSPDSANWRTR